MQETPVRCLGWEDPLEKGKSCPLQYSVLENSLDRTVRGVAKSLTGLSDISLLASLAAHTAKRLPAVQETWVWSLGWDSPGEGNGNPLQYSYLENPTDGGAWQATVCGVTESQTCLATSPPFGGSAGKNLPAVQETRVQSLGREDPLRRAWPPTPAFLPGESHGQRSRAGDSPQGRAEWDVLEHSAGSYWLSLLHVCVYSCVHTQPCPHCRNPMDGSPPGPSVCGVFLVTSVCQSQPPSLYLPPSCPGDHRFVFCICDFASTL